MHEVIKTAVTLSLETLGLALFYYLFIRLFVDELGTIFELGQHLLLIASIFFPVLLSIILSFNFPQDIREDIVIRIRSDLKDIIDSSIFRFILTTLCLLPVFIYSDEVREFKGSRIVISLVMGLVTTNIIYYIIRFYQLFGLNTELRQASKIEA